MTTKIFLASSAELKDDRREFEILINRKNKAWAAQGVLLELVLWEDFLDALSPTRLQDEYNKAISQCDIFVMLFWTKVGKYTEEEFEHAVGQFKATRKPFIYTYFKDAPVSTGSVDEDGLMSLLQFKKKLAALGHFHTTYKNVEGLQLHFLQQLDKLVANGFIEFPRQDAAGARSGGTTYQATIAGDGAIAQGAGARAVGRGGVLVGGSNSGNISTGTQTTTHTGGGASIGGNVKVVGGNFIGRDSVTTGVSARELEPLFAQLLATVAALAPVGAQAAATGQVEQLKAEVAKGRGADDGKVAKLVEGLVGLVPGAVSAVVSAFATPLLGGIAGPVTEYVLGKLTPD
jgi:hypothetical protein